MDASGDTSADATLALRAAQAERSIRAPLVEGAVTRLALAGAGVDRAWTGFQTSLNPAGHDPARPRHYAFDLAVVPAGLAADAGTGVDAAAALADATPVAGGCVTGRLRPLAGLGDAVDAFRFQARAGSPVGERRSRRQARMRS